MFRHESELNSGVKASILTCSSMNIRQLEPEFEVQIQILKFRHELQPELEGATSCLLSDCKGLSS